MNPLEIYDYLVQARKRWLGWVRSLSHERYAARLPNWGWSIAETVTHLLICEWYYVQRVRKNDVPPYEKWAIRQEEPPPLEKLESLWDEQAAETRAALEAVRDWSAPIEYRAEQEDGREALVTTSAGALFTQLAFHEVHHRAQLMNMLRQRGVSLEDLDFNALTFDLRYD